MPSVEELEPVIKRTDAEHLHVYVMHDGKRHLVDFWDPPAGDGLWVDAVYRIDPSGRVDIDPKLDGHTSAEQAAWAVLPDKPADYPAVGEYTGPLQKWLV